MPARFRSARARRPARLARARAADHRGFRTELEVPFGAEKPACPRIQTLQPLPSSRALVAAFERCKRGDGALTRMAWRRRFRPVAAADVRLTSSRLRLRQS